MRNICNHALRFSIFFDYGEAGGGWGALDLTGTTIDGRIGFVAWTSKIANTSFERTSRTWTYSMRRSSNDRTAFSELEVQATTSFSLLALLLHGYWVVNAHRHSLPFE